jgi:hypothetical protein
VGGIFPQIESVNMSKLQLKKELQRLDKEQLIEQICELYSTYKPVKEYYHSLLHPDNIQELYEKYKAAIVNEFYPVGKRGPKLRFSVAKKAISDFCLLKPPPKLVAELMVTLAENACKFTNDFGDMPEQFYNSAANNFERALKFLQKEELLDDYQPRFEKCLQYVEYCGYGFADGINDVYNEYYT